MVCCAAWKPSRARIASAPPQPAPARPSLAEAAYAALKASILEGLLPPGEEAVEQAIADQLGMSRTPVHEAVLRLQHEGFLRVLPRRGVRVLPIDPEDLRQTYEVLIALEGAAAALLAARGAAAGATLDAMRDATAAMAAALAAATAPAGRRPMTASTARCSPAAATRSWPGWRRPRPTRRSAPAARRRRGGRNPRPPRASMARSWPRSHAGDGEAAREAVAAHRTRASREILRALGA